MLRVVSACHAFRRIAYRDGLTVHCCDVHSLATIDNAEPSVLECCTGDMLILNAEIGRSSAVIVLWTGDFIGRFVRLLLSQVNCFARAFRGDANG